MLTHTLPARSQNFPSRLLQLEYPAVPLR